MITDEIKQALRDASANCCPSRDDLCKEDLHHVCLCEAEGVRAIEAAAPLIRAADAARIARVEAALKQAGAWFSGYAEMHEAKGSHDKAEANAHRAKFCMDVAEGTNDDGGDAMISTQEIRSVALTVVDDRAARIAELEAALAPFVQAAAQYATPDALEVWPNNHYVMFPLGDLCRAAAVMEPKP